MNSNGKTGPGGEWWENLGFEGKPVRCEASGGEVLYRVYGRGIHGDSGPLEIRKEEAWFTPHELKRVSEAVRLLAAVEYGNHGSMLETWRVKAGTVMWVGAIRRRGFLVAPPALAPVSLGGRVWCGPTQVWIEKPRGQLTPVGLPRALEVDVWVGPMEPPVDGDPEGWGHGGRLSH